MDRRYSPITDLYGLSPRDEPPEKKGYGWLIVLLVLAGLFVYESISPVMQLRPNPPAVFVGARLNSDESAYHAQQRMARECWEYAIQQLQDVYPYGQPLPRSPTFGLVKAPAIRIQCWPRLQHVWTMDESWMRSYEWSTGWLTDRQGALQETLRRLWDYLRMAT